MSFWQDEKSKDVETVEAEEPQSKDEPDSKAKEIETAATEKADSKAKDTETTHEEEKGRPPSINS